MGRLIDEDVLLARISLNYNNHQNISAGAMKDIINTTPTAYDVEDILVALKIMRNDTNQGCLKVDMKKCNQYSDCGLCIMDRAIDIVKAGGVE